MRGQPGVCGAVAHTRAGQLRSSRGTGLAGRRVLQLQLPVLPVGGQAGAREGRGRGVEGSLRRRLLGTASWVVATAYAVCVCACAVCWCDGGCSSSCPRAPRRQRRPPCCLLSAARALVRVRVCVRRAGHALWCVTCMHGARWGVRCILHALRVWMRQLCDAAPDSR
jgi:hypothetical protein